MRRFANSLKNRVAQLVEQRTENPRVGGSSPPPGTTFLSGSLDHSLCRLLCFHIILCLFMAFCHFKSDQRVTVVLVIV